MSLLSNHTPEEHRYHLHLTNLLHHQNYLLKVIETSCQTILVETLKVPPQNLLHFIKKVWKNNKGMISTHALESLIESICSKLHTEFDPQLRKNCIFSLCYVLKHIGKDQSGLVNTRILNRIIEYFSIMKGQGEFALEVFHSFDDIFECVPNQDTYYFTLQALLSSTTYSSDMIQQAASICQKMMLLPPHDHDAVLICFFLLRTTMSLHPNYSRIF